jgi:hypothetical protein
VPEITTVPTTEAITTTITEVTTVPTTEPLTTTVTEITTVPTTATTTEITTVTEEFVDIADILTDQPTGEVKVRGVVYYAIAGTEQPSYYLYDGTGYILVIDSNVVEIGDGVQFSAEFDTSEPAPQLINVSGFLGYSEKPALPEYVVTGIPDIVAHPDTDYTFYGSPLRITGVVTSMGPALMLENGASKVILNNKAFLAGNPFLSLIGQTVTINAVVHFYDDMMSAWHVLYDPAYPVEEEEPIVENPFIPGSGGVLSERTPSVLEPGTFAGLMITKVDREPGAFGGVSNVVEMMFPYPDNFDATSYTLQYFDANDSTWKNYQHNDEDLTTTGDNFSLTMYESMTLRLIINDGPNAGFTSNEQSYVLSVQDCRYLGYLIEYGINDEGIMVPFVGFTIHASFTAENFSDETIVDVSNTLTYKWYRLDPITYEMILIESATGLIEYDATMADVGYYICVIAEGDGINSDGMYFAMVDWIVLAGNPGFITNASASGFTIN